MTSERVEYYQDSAQALIKSHQKEAEESFDHFKNGLLSQLAGDLKSIDAELRKQLSGVSRKLQNKIRHNFSVGSLRTSMVKFFLEPYVTKEYENVQKAIQRLRSKIFEYIQNFAKNLLQNNIKKCNEVSLFHYQNRIKHIHQQWYSVTSRSPLEKAQIKVWGLRRPQTSWLVLGVTKKLKQYGQVNKSINQEQFLGNIYLNGSQSMEGGYKLKKNLMENDVFVIENMNRMIFVYKKEKGRNLEETFILDDNTDYYFYLAMKGPLTIQFIGE